LQEQVDKNTIITNVVVGRLEEQLQSEMSNKSQFEKMAKLAKHMPEFIRKIKQWESETKILKMDLHFAFLFACPLVMQQATGMSIVPQLNYDKEFTKIKERMEGAGEIKYQKR
jgi:microcompartment protein CcmL/EutN